MSDTAIYLARAEEARADAAAATLDNVRETCLRSEKAWSAMAVRAQHSEELRIKRVAEAAGRKAAEADQPELAEGAS